MREIRNGGRIIHEFFMQNARTSDVLVTNCIQSSLGSGLRTLAALGTVSELMLRKQRS